MGTNYIITNDDKREYINIGKKRFNKNSSIGFTMNDNRIVNFLASFDDHERIRIIPDNSPEFIYVENKYKEVDSIWSKYVELKEFT